jgi:hypothetical protein
VDRKPGCDWRTSASDAAATGGAAPLGPRAPVARAHTSRANARRSQRLAQFCPHARQSRGSPFWPDEHRRTHAHQSHLHAHYSHERASFGPRALLARANNPSATLLARASILWPTRTTRTGKHALAHAHYSCGRAPLGPREPFGRARPHDVHMGCSISNRPPAPRRLSEIVEENLSDFRTQILEVKGAPARKRLAGKVTRASERSSTRRDATRRAR